uniref:Uncharacterized protein n=1 Tax=Anopheles culicifacies TaxID=139723 RepID=A0A182MQ96_9DIPT
MSESRRPSHVPVVGVDTRGHAGATLVSSIGSTVAIRNGTDAMLIQGDKSATGSRTFGPAGGTDHQPGSIATYDSDGEDPSTGSTNDDRKDTNLKDLNDNSSSSGPEHRTKLDSSSGKQRAVPTSCTATVSQPSTVSTVLAANQPVSVRDPSLQQQLYPEGRHTMNISTEYAPTDGMSRSYHSRSSYHSRYYASSPASPGPGHIPPYSSTMDGGHHSRRQHDPVGGFGEAGGYGSEKAFYAPPPLGSDSYASSGPDERHPAYLANYYGAAGYSHQGMLRMPPEHHGAYGGCYGTPPIPWYHQPHSSYHHQHHGHHHSHQQQQQQHSATPRGYPMPPEHMYNMFNFNR